MGISPSTPKGLLKRPDAEKITGFVLGKFKTSEQEKLKKARGDKDIKGILLRINSPGGSATASDIIYKEIEDFKRDIKTSQ